ncbi:MAG: zinc-ribbon domain-containing protein [Planctomycetes bacterium]|nr:zinc-ribbon domain-containing protein [Planctomycetota bacterium]
MEEKIRCPSCNKKLKVSSENFGKKIKCPKCDHTFKLEKPADDEPEAPAAPEIEDIPAPVAKKKDEEKFEIADDDDDIPAPSKPAAAEKDVTPEPAPKVAATNLAPPKLVASSEHRHSDLSSLSDDLLAWYVNELSEKKAAINDILASKGSKVRIGGVKVRMGLPIEATFEIVDS